MSHKAEIIAVGSELLLGNVANTDARYVSEKRSHLPGWMCFTIQQWATIPGACDR